ncbi:acyl-CoA thioesterase [Ramlibacter rhizophilus]|uniref:Acyl-CoA thioesterase n=1 Tax=Ramlibacter rhizophilus TaxID=1781167 RepID=A0A4Z0BPK9_9BURK|nr:acyl-CoA thioesterase [Ramlibacter rhizophilus]TFZ01233.1 acyl-CoA thioesterase [Ramlibacter rhizophilus]
MSTPHKTITYSLRVEFGDCDPAGIVWFPNFFRWIDAASRNFFIQCGVPPWREIEKETGIVGTPIVDTKARFMKTASYGDELQIDVHVPEWRRKSFVQRYHCRRGDTPIMECEEVRIFGGRREDGSWYAFEVPERIRRLCE